MTGNVAHPEEQPQEAPRRVSVQAGKAKVEVGSASYLRMSGQLEDAEESNGGHKPHHGTVAADQLRSIIERIERMNEEAAGIASDIRDIYAESKSNGYCVKTLRKVIALRKLDAAERDEADHLLDTYCVALGMKAQMDMFNETLS